MMRADAGACCAWHPGQRLGRATRELGGALLVAAVIVLFTANAFLHFPGVMNNDSVIQYRQALSGQYSDWHPPVMAWLWSLLQHVGQGPGPLLLLHLALYWLGFGLLADGLRRSGHPGCAMLVVLGGAFPPFLHINAQVVKDVGMVAAWLPAVGLLYWFRSQQRRMHPLAVVAVAALLAYGTLVRSNAVFGLGPLLAYALAPAPWWRNTRLMIAAVVVALAAIPVSQQLNRWLFQPAQQHPEYSLFLFDLMGIAVHEHDPGLMEPRATLTAADLAACYTPYWWDSLSPWGRCSARTHRPNDELAAYGEGLAQQWASTILHHPVAYAAHRLKHFNSSLLFAVPPKHIRLTPEYRTDDPAVAPLEVVTEHDVHMDLVRKNPAIWPVVWLTWAIFLLAILVREPVGAAVGAARVLAVSALGYSGAYLVIGVATDMRYHYWSLIAVFMAGLLVLPQLGAAWRQRSRPLLAGLGAVGLVILIGVAARLMDFRGLV